MTDPTNKLRGKIVYDHDEESDEIDDLKQDNSFEDGNKIYELKSEIHSLQIQKNKLSLQHQAALASSEAKNQQLSQHINSLKKENARLMNNIRKLETDNEELKKTIDNYKGQAEGMNRRTADFHRSMDDHQGLGDPTQLINQLLSKDKKIQQLSKKIESLELRPNSSLSMNSNKMTQIEKQKYEQQIKNLKTVIDELKKKQIAYKREYENMIQAKQQIIKKMSAQNEDFCRKLSQSKDKIISELKKQHEDQDKKIEVYKNEIAVANQKLSTFDKQLNRMKLQSKRKEQSLVNHYESQKQEITKGLNEKLKRHIKDKQQKLGRNEQRILELENQVMIYKQQLGKQKAQTVSLNQYNSYLQTSNKEYEESKKKLQTAIYEKQKQIGEVRQSSFTQINELKKNIIQERSQFQQKISSLEQQLLEKRINLQKLEQEVYELSKKQEEGTRQTQVNFQKEIEKLTKQKEFLSNDLEALQERYQQKSQKMNNLQKKIRKQYEQRVSSLQSQLIKEREKSKQFSKPVPQPVLQKKQSKQPQSQELQKYINISQLRRIQVEEKQQEVRKVTEEKNRAEREANRIKQDYSAVEKKLKQKIEDYKNLQISFEELSQKYRKGVKQLQIKIEQTQQQIIEQRKRAQKRKNESAQNQKNMSQQLKQYKSKIKQLQQQLYEYKNRKMQDAQQTDLKLQKLTHQISLINKQKQSSLKKQERKIRQKQDVLQEEKNKLLEYIEQLQENNNILNKKIGMLESKDKKNNNMLEKQLRDLKVQYSDSLKEVNLVLQKYKKLEDLHRETLVAMDNLKEEKDLLNKKYVEIHREKNKIFDELNSAYDQINKLNIVLMSKEEQLSRSKVVNCPHYESKSRVIYSTNVQPVNQTPGFVGLNPSRSKSPMRFYDKPESLYSMQQQNPQHRYQPPRYS